MGVNAASHAWTKHCKNHRFTGYLNLHGKSLTTALHDFLDDAGGSHCLQCDFRTKFIGGKFCQVLHKHCGHVTAAPPSLLLLVADYALDDSPDLEDVMCKGGLEVWPLHQNSVLQAAHLVGSTLFFQTPGGKNLTSRAVLALPIAHDQEFHAVQLEDETTTNLQPIKVMDSSSATWVRKI